MNRIMEDHKRRVTLLAGFPDELHEEAMKELEALRAKHPGHYDHDLLMFMVLKRMQPGTLGQQALGYSVLIEHCDRILKAAHVQSATPVLKRINILAADMRNMLLTASATYTVPKDTGILAPGKDLPHIPKSPADQGGPAHAFEISRFYKVRFQTKKMQAPAEFIGKCVGISKVVMFDVKGYDNALRLAPSEIKEAELAHDSWLEGDVVHALSAGRPACGFTTQQPRAWPRGHTWTHIDDIEKVTCTGCLEAFDYVLQSSSRGVFMGWAGRDKARFSTTARLTAGMRFNTPGVAKATLAAINAIKHHKGLHLSAIPK